MELYLVLLSTILAFSLGSTEQYVSSLDSMKNTSGRSITKVDTRRYTKKENSQPLSVNVHQGTGHKTEQLDSVDTAHPSLHDTSKCGAVQPTAASTSTANASSSTTTNTSTTTTTTTTTNTSTSITDISTTTSTNSTTNTSTTTITTTTTTTTNTNTTTPKSCPRSGYQLYPEFNCYKAVPGEAKTWSDAREQCRRDGGDLMVMETEQEREEVYIPLHNSVGGWISWSWVGVYFPEGGDGWNTVRGQPALSTWWRPGYPKKDAGYKCALADSTGLLGDADCAYLRNFICEISL